MGTSTSAHRELLLEERESYHYRRRERDDAVERGWLSSLAATVVGVVGCHWCLVGKVAKVTEGGGREG